jgi:hypothetical protein
MAFGIVTGTFSSIYVAAPVLLWIERRWPREASTAKAGSVREGPSGASKKPAPRGSQPTGQAANAPAR